MVLPTGAGKSLVIANLALLAKGRVLLLTHVKELVEQNYDKYCSYGYKAGIYSAGLERKDTKDKVIFGGIQSVARAEKGFFRDISLVIIDECHRVSMEEDSQYQKVFKKLTSLNPKVKFVGLTATPYRLGQGYIFNEHTSGRIVSVEKRFFKKCVFELSLAFMIKNNYLTQPIHINAPVACYDFSSLEQSYDTGKFSMSELAELIKNQARVTPGIVRHIVSEAKERNGVMIFASTVAHAREVLSYLPENEAQIITGDTDNIQRDQIISDFKEMKIKFLVNVSVLTTGFDAPHVDLIAIMRPTESISLYQQIVGRGLRLFEGKKIA